ncbi:MAG: fibronectin type III domain-containing protein [Kofleriaceae bacterium]
MSRWVVLFCLAGCSFSPPTLTPDVDALLDVPPEGAPGAPTDLVAMPRDHELAVTWTAPDPGTSAIQSYAATAVPDDPGLPVRSCISATPSCTMIGVVNGVTYTINVTATNAAGTGAPSGQARAMPIPNVLGDPQVQLWLDAAAPETLTTTSGAVAAWSDRSPRSRSAAQATAEQQPLYEPTGVAGHAAITFDGVDDGLVSIGFVAGDTSYTIFTAGANRDAAVPITNYVSVLYASMNCGSGSPGFAAYAYSSFLTPNDVRIPNVESGNAASNSVRIDGSPAVAIPNNTNSTHPNVIVPAGQWLLVTQQVRTTGNPGGSELFLGRYRNGCQHGKVSLGELVVFDRVLSTAEIAAVEDYLSHKWRVALR